MITLLDSTQTQLNGMSDDDLITLAGSILFCRKVIMQPALYQLHQLAYANSRLDEYGVTLDQTVTFAHWLLNKAL